MIREKSQDSSMYRKSYTLPRPPIHNDWTDPNLQGFSTENCEVHFVERNSFRCSPPFPALPVLFLPAFGGAKPCWWGSPRLWPVSRPSHHRCGRSPDRATPPEVILFTNPFGSIPKRGATKPRSGLTAKPRVAQRTLGWQPRKGSRTPKGHYQTAKQFNA